MKRFEETFVDLQGLNPMRCDQYVADIWQLHTRSQLKSLQVCVTLDDKQAKWSQKVRNGQHICLTWDETNSEFVPEKMDLDILYEDDDVWVINKPAGLVVHPGAGHYNGTLANALAYLLGERAYQFPDLMRVGIVHRLDKETSGVLICAKTVQALEFLSCQFRQRQVRKYYLALCQTHLSVPLQGQVENYLCRSPFDRRCFMCSPTQQGRYAASSYRILRRCENFSLVLLQPHTGRTHQLRVHTKFLGIPILGDTLYCPHEKQQNCGLMLHAWKLKITLPSGGPPREFCASVPERFYTYWETYYKI